MGLLGSILEPNPQGGLLDFAMNLAQAGGSGAPTMAGLAQAGQATRQDMLQARQYQQDQQEYARKKRLQDIQEKAISQITDADLKTLAALDPTGQTVAEVMAAKLKGRYGYGSSVPADIQKYEYYNNLPEDKKPVFMNMIRAGQVLDMGGYYGVRDPNTNQIIPLGQKGLNPGEEPSVRGAQTAASETAKIGVEFNAAMGKKEIDANDSLAILSRAKDALQDGPTGSGLGAARDVALGLFGVSTNAGNAAARLDILAPILIGKVPRFEGPQSDADRRLYEAAAGRLNDRNLPVSTRLAALEEMERTAKSNIETARRWKEQAGHQPASAQPSSGMPPADAIRAERERRAAMRGAN